MLMDRDDYGEWMTSDDDHSDGRRRINPWQRMREDGSHHSDGVKIKPDISCLTTLILLAGYTSE
jgi:hypothetical protein